MQYPKDVEYHTKSRFFHLLPFYQREKKRLLLNTKKIKKKIKWSKGLFTKVEMNIVRVPTQETAASRNDKEEIEF